MAKAMSLKDTPKARMESLAKEKKQAQKKNITEGKKLENFNTRLISDLHIDMKVYCAKNRMKIQEFVNDAIQEKLKASNKVK